MHKAWNNKGDALEQGKYDEAIKAYDEAIRLDPNEADAWNAKAMLSLIRANTMRPSRLMTKPSGSIPKMPMPGTTKVLLSSQGQV